MGIGYIIGPQLSVHQRRRRRDRVVGADSAAAVLRSRSAAPPGRRANPQWDVAAYTVWYNIVRPIAVGTMLVGACHTLFSMRASITQSIAGALGASRAAGAMEGDTRATAPIATFRSAGWCSAPSC